LGTYAIINVVSSVDSRLIQSNPGMHPYTLHALKHW